MEVFLNKFLYLYIVSQSWKRVDDYTISLFSVKNKLFNDKVDVSLTLFPLTFLVVSANSRETRSFR